MPSPRIIQVRTTDLRHGGSKWECRSYYALTLVTKPSVTRYWFWQGRRIMRRTFYSWKYRLGGNDV